MSTVAASWRAGTGPDVTAFCVKRVTITAMPIDPAMRCQMLKSVFASASRASSTPCNITASSGEITKPMDAARQASTSEVTQSGVARSMASSATLAAVRSAKPSATVTRTLSRSRSFGPKARLSPVSTPWGSSAAPAASAVYPWAVCMNTGSRKIAA